MAKQSGPYPTREMNELFEAIIAVRTKSEAKKFFRDLLTIAELSEFSNRWQIVKLLRQGLSYAVIAERLGVSTATVTRVAHWLNHGMDGYKLIADRVLPKKK